MEQTIYDAIQWQRSQLPGDAAVGTMNLTYGQVGDGGPTAALVAGIHGDEGPWGALAIRSLLMRPMHQLQGTLRIVFAANPMAAAIDGRYSPLDHLDLNETFPGNASGSHTERLAQAIMAVIGESEVLLDLHGGGSWCVNSFVFRLKGSEELANGFGAPYVIDMPTKERTVTHQAWVRGARVVSIEMGGRCDAELAWRDRISDGLARTLVGTGVLTSEALPTNAPAPSREVTDMHVLRPSTGGLLVPRLTERDIDRAVPEGTILADLYDLHTLAPIETFVAPYPETAILLLRPHVCRLEGGAMTIIVGRPI